MRVEPCRSAGIEPARQLDVIRNESSGNGSGARGRRARCGGEGRHADSFDDRRGGTVALVDFGEHLCQTEWAHRVTDHAVSGFGGAAMAAGARCEAIEHFEADIVEGP
jgi:hypothetical protein